MPGDTSVSLAGIAGIALLNTERLCHDARLFFSKLFCVAEQYWIRVSPRTALKWTSPLLVKTIATGQMDLPRLRSNRALRNIQVSQDE